MIKYLPPFDVRVCEWIFAHQSNKLEEREKKGVAYTKEWGGDNGKENNIEKIAHIDDTRAWRDTYIGRQIISEQL